MDEGVEMPAGRLRSCVELDAELTAVDEMADGDGGARVLLMCGTSKALESRGLLVLSSIVYLVKAGDVIAMRGRGLFVYACAQAGVLLLDGSL